MSKPAPNKRVKQHWARLRRIGCIACIKEGSGWTAPHIHHIRVGQGAAQRENHWIVLPLCPGHHQTGRYSVHGGPQLFAMRFGTELALLDEVLELVYG